MTTTYMVGWSPIDAPTNEHELPHPTREEAQEALAALQAKHTDEDYGGDIEANDRMYWVRPVEE